jgi:hypothetical protein
MKTDCNGWKNYETWNVALWIGSDEGLYGLAREHRSYKSFANMIMDPDFGSIAAGTPDGVSWIDPDLDIEALDEMIEEL